MIYMIPALTHENEFFDLELVGRYVDRLIKSSGDRQYGVVYEWTRDDFRDGPPDSILMRLSSGDWLRRVVLATSVPDMPGCFTLAMADE
jgi:hypothetical protein